MKKKLILAGTVITLAATIITGCGDSDNNESTKASESISQTTTENKTQTTSETKAVDTKIKLATIENKTAFLGTNDTLECVATIGDNSELSYTWYETKSGKIEDIIAINRGAENKSTLTIDTSKLGIKYYVCMVESKYGESVYSNVVKVTVQPKITVPEYLEVNKGDLLDIYCAVSPEGKYSYMWYETSTGKLQDIIAINRGSETSDTLHLDSSTPSTRYYVCGIATVDGRMYYSDVVKIIIK